MLRQAQHDIALQINFESWQLHSAVLPLEKVEEAAQQNTASPDDYIGMCHLSGEAVETDG